MVTPLCFSGGTIRFYPKERGGRREPVIDGRVAALLRSARASLSRVSSDRWG